MKRSRKNFTVLFLGLSSLALVLIFAVIIVSALLAKEKSVHSAFLQSSAEELESAEAQRKDLLAEQEALLSQLDVLKAEKAQLIQDFEDSDTRYRQLNEQIALLNDEIAKRDNNIAELQSNIKRLEKVYLVDINAQFDILNQLTALFENPVMIEIKTQVTKDDGTVEEQVTYEKPRLSVYYEDLTSGYRYAYNADEVFDSASMIKEPFILSILQQASKEEAEIKAAELAAKLEGKEYTPPERVYDFTPKIVYTKDAYYRPGSGEIIQGEDGVEYSYQDLIYHVLHCSDNVGYSVLREVFPMTYFSEMVYRLKASSMYKSLSNMSAADAGKIMKETYAFLESDAFYAPFMKDAMTSSQHTVLTAAGAPGRKVAHKYGWDTGAYHDMGIVYDENPYVIAVLSNYDTGGKEINEYLQSILRLIDKLHQNFYMAR